MDNTVTFNIFNSANSIITQIMTTITDKILKFKPIIENQL